MKRTSQRPSKLSDSVHHQLSMYALAASAAGVGMLALAQPAEAKIVYTKAHLVIPAHGGYSLDLNHDGTADFSFANFLILSDTQGGFVYVAGAGNCGRSSANMALGPRSGAYALAAGVRIGPKAHPFDWKAYMASCVGPKSGFGSTVCRGPWLDVKSRYLGLKFRIGTQTHYGWARLNIGHSGFEMSALLTGYAYETIPNKPIITGKTKGPDVITLGPGSLGALAAGAPRLHK